ncbi:cobalamin biosynthesis protein [Chloroflexota bacterium]
MDILLILFLAVTIDLAIGEPPRCLHPVVWIGKLVSLLERGCKSRRPAAQFLYGLGMTLFTAGLFTAAACFLLAYLKNLNFIAYIIVGAFLLKSTFSLRELRRTAIGIKKLLLEDKLDKARFDLRAMVSRNTHSLPKPLLISAVVESVAESTGDSLVAPLFYFLLLGVPGAIAYRVVNTLDSMVGYHGKYEYSGKFASRLDDVLNFIPARLAALLLVLAAFLSRKSGRAAWRVALREHARTESINAGWPMAATAGALGVQLEKVGHYKLGKANTPLTPETIDASLKLLYLTMFAWSLICLAAGGIRFVLAT